MTLRHARISRRRAAAFLIVLFAAIMAGTGLASAGERYALLVGVTKYPSLPSELQLVGPQNDVALVAKVLAGLGFKKANIRVLAEKPAGQKSPTRAAILGGLADLAANVKKGDYVYLHFSGHGSRQPANPKATGRARETDGLDEIFLPADIGRWDSDIGSVKGAILDDEIGAAITKIRNKGAFVWAVFDACHSGTMTRGVPVDGVRLRKVRPSVLGIPRGRPPAMAPRDESPAVAAGDVGLRSDAGGFVAFYAAQTTEQTPEMRLPRGDPKRVSQGLFTYTLMSVLASHPTATYRQAGQMILQRYAAGFYRAHTPMFEGTGLDAPVLGTEPGKRVVQWPVAKTAKKLSLPAGSLHGLAAGSLLALVAGPAAPEKQILGYVKVIAGDATRSTIVPVAAKGKLALALAKVPTGAYARPVESSFVPVLRVARPRITGAVSANAKKVLDAIARIDAESESKAGGVAVRWVAPGEDADLRLAIDLSGGKHAPALWLLPPSGELVREGAAKTHSISLAADAASVHDRLRVSLVNIAKVTNLLRLAGRLSVGTSKLELGIKVLTRSPASRRPKPAAGKAERFRSPVVPTLYGGEVLEIRLDNKGRGPVDVTILAIDSSYGVTVIFPQPGEPNRITAGGSYVINDAEVDAATLGLERLLVIAVDAKPNTEMANFAFLEQPALARTRGRGVEGGLENLLRQAGFARARTRALKVPKRTSGGATMLLFSWKTAPGK